MATGCALSVATQSKNGAMARAPGIELHLRLPGLASLFGSGPIGLTMSLRILRSPTRTSARYGSRVGGRAHPLWRDTDNPFHSRARTATCAPFFMGLCPGCGPPRRHAATPGTGSPGCECPPAPAVGRHLLLDFAPRATGTRRGYFVAAGKSKTEPCFGKSRSPGVAGSLSGAKSRRRQPPQADAGGHSPRKAAGRAGAPRTQPALER